TVLPDQNIDGSKYAAPYAGGPPNESLKGLWWIPEFIPKPYRDPRADYDKRWMIHAGRHRYVADDATLHPAVGERLAGVAAGRWRVPRATPRSTGCSGP